MRGALRWSRMRRTSPTARRMRASQAQREALEGRLPKDAQELFAWLLQQPQSEVLELLAFCVAHSVDGVKR